MTVLYTSIGELVTNDPAQGAGGPLGIVSDAAIAVDGADIAWVGSRVDAPDAEPKTAALALASGRATLAILAGTAADHDF
jgi:imidazolonepropionase